jgi:hypothetical protein
MAFPLPTALLERLRLVREGANFEGGPVIQGVRGVRCRKGDVDRGGGTPETAYDPGPE